ncbi:MAG: hypothetical protein IKP49_01360 [Treponema sp.]|nr:hypothetical protein [Treponema sp.]
MNNKKRNGLLFCFLFFATILLSATPLSDEQKRELDIAQISQRIRRNGKLPLYFADAEDGTPVAGVQIRVDSVGSFVSDKKGFISLPALSDGDYSLTLSANGYNAECFDFSVRAGFIPRYRFAISKVLVGSYVRIVLEWGEQPTDLDLHLEQEGGYHISYRNMRVSSDETAQLDRDDINSYGPETITISEWTPNTRYFVYVVDYTNRMQVKSSALSNSTATVKVYDKNGFIQAFAVPIGQLGNRWNVCDMYNGHLNSNQTVITNF